MPSKNGPEVEFACEFVGAGDPFTTASGAKSVDMTVLTDGGEELKVTVWGGSDYLRGLPHRTRMLVRGRLGSFRSRKTGILFLTLSLIGKVEDAVRAAREADPPPGRPERLQDPIPDGPSLPGEDGGNIPF